MPTKQFIIQFSFLYLQKNVIFARVTIELKWLKSLPPTPNKTFPKSYCLCSTTHQVRAKLSTASSGHI